MIYYFNVYGFLNDDILEQKAALEECLNFSLSEKDSIYYGIAFSLKNSDNENYILEKNFDGEGFLEESYENYPVIFSATVKGGDKANYMEKKILSMSDSVLIKKRKLSI